MLRFYAYWYFIDYKEIVVIMLHFQRLGHNRITPGSINFGFYSWRFPLFDPMGISMGVPQQKDGWFHGNESKQPWKWVYNRNEWKTSWTNGWFETLRVPAFRESSISHDPRWCVRAQSAKPSLRWWSGDRRRSASHAEFPGESYLELNTIWIKHGSGRFRIEWSFWWTSLTDIAYCDEHHLWCW